jgi:Tfp pilus assembly protein FimT
MQPDAFGWSSMNRAGARTVGPGREGGFTLTEALLVLVVFGMMMSIAIPRMDTYARAARRRSALAQFTAAHSLARTAAVRYGRPAEFHIDATTARFWVEVDTATGSGGHRDTLGLIHNVAEGPVTMTSTRSVVCFDRRGLAYTDGTCQSGNLMVTFTAASVADTVQTTVLGKILR